MPMIQTEVTLQMAYHLEPNMKTYQKAGYALSVGQEKDAQKDMKYGRTKKKTFGFGVSFLL